MDNRNSGSGAFLGGAAVVIGIVLAIWFVCFLAATFSARYTPQAGQIGVVRQGGSFWWIGDWFNGHNIIKVVPPGSGNTNIGKGSTVHTYPASSVQRLYTITSDPNRGDRPGVDVVTVPTADGVNVGLEGTIYFQTAFNGSSEGVNLVKDFDNRVGTRTFPVVGGNGGELHAWDGNDGWEAFLDGAVRPIIDNDLRQEIGTFTCAQLQTACAYLNSGTATKVSSQSGQAANQRIQAIQTAINSSLEADIKSTLGQDYFSAVEFRLSRVTLPPRVQNEIENAQAAKAQATTAQAQVQVADQQAAANKARERGYENCPACAAIDELKAIPSNVTTFAPGAGFAITQPGK